MFSASLSVVISLHVMRNSHKSIVNNVVYDGVIFGWRLYLFVFFPFSIKMMEDGWFILHFSVPFEWT